MMKKTTIVALFLFVTALLFQMAPPTATCPYDGEMAGLTKTVGAGSGRVCWYAHDHLDRQTFQTVHHSFYNQCPE